MSHAGSEEGVRSIVIYLSVDGLILQQGKIGHMIDKVDNWRMSGLERRRETQSKLSRIEILPGG